MMTGFGGGGGAGGAGGASVGGVGNSGMFCAAAGTAAMVAMSAMVGADIAAAIPIAQRVRAGLVRRRRRCPNHFIIRPRTTRDIRRTARTAPRDANAEAP